MISLEPEIPNRVRPALFASHVGAPHLVLLVRGEGIGERSNKYQKG